MGEAKINHGGLFSRGVKAVLAAPDRQLWSEAYQQAGAGHLGEKRNCADRVETSALGRGKRHESAAFIVDRLGLELKLASRYHASPDRRWGWGGGKS